MNKRIAIVHFQPLEKYPPVLNLINCLSKAYSQDPAEVYVYTNYSFDQNSVYAPPGNRIFVFRYTDLNQNSSKWNRMLGYLKFYFVTFWKLLKLKPGKVLVYESLSILPVWLWSFFKQINSDIYIHYHEYTSAEEYKMGPFIMKVNHLVEKQLIQKAIWASHTNEKRLDKFLNDFRLTRDKKYHLLANYPPASWLSKLTKKNDNNLASNRLRIIYVGALSLETMYVKEFAGWVSKYPDMLYWDIYSQQPTDDFFAFLQQKRAKNICVKGFAEYNDLPNILENYDVGVILYKGHTPNYVYNAPNKLFEYLIKGLDVWYPEEMKGIHPYQTSGQYPQVVSLNFKDLQKINPMKLVRNKTLAYVPFTNSAENEYAQIIEKLNS